jgi:hypothetical protein
VELQVDLKVVPTGVTEAGAWNYAFTCELFQRWFPEIPEQACGVKLGLTLCCLGVIILIDKHFH